MATPLSRTFKSLKPHSNSILPISKPTNSSQIPSNVLPQVQCSNKPSSSSASTPPPENPNPWAVYLILSTNPPIKTYVGVTNNFSRRLKQHNGELVGGAKASTAGRPWTCACLIQGFMDKRKVSHVSLLWRTMDKRYKYGAMPFSRLPLSYPVDNDELIFICKKASMSSTAYQFESKWKSISRKLPRKRSGKNQEQAESSQHLLLQHRYSALNRLKDFIDCSHLEINWHLDPT